MLLTRHPETRGDANKVIEASGEDEMREGKAKPPKATGIGTIPSLSYLLPGAMPSSITAVHSEWKTLDKVMTCCAKLAPMVQTGSHLSPYPRKLVAPQGLFYLPVTSVPYTSLVAHWGNKNTQSFWTLLNVELKSLPFPLNSQEGAILHAGHASKTIKYMDALTQVLATWKQPMFLAFLVELPQWMLMTLPPLVKMTDEEELLVLLVKRPLGIYKKPVQIVDAALGVEAPVWDSSG
ncbi:hypothetical protein CB1_000812050 [Camelus ferus]|nr:hypothetical protein CB1_000812050 [Camelus ferus]